MGRGTGGERSGHQALETVGQRVGGFLGDGDAVVVEGRLVVAGEQEGERSPTRRQFGNGQRVHRGIHLRLEVIDAELVKVAEDNVARAVGDKAGPVVEGLAVVALEVHAALLHFEQDDRLPDQVGKGGATAVFGSLADAEFGLAAYVKNARVAERLEQPVQKDLGLALLIPGDVLLRPADKLRELFLTRHGRVLQEKGVGVSRETWAFGEGCQPIRGLAGGGACFTVAGVWTRWTMARGCFRPEVPDEHSQRRG